MSAADKGWQRLVWAAWWLAYVTGRPRRRTALAGIQASVVPPYRPPTQTTCTADGVQCVASPVTVSRWPSDQETSTTTCTGSGARVTGDPTAPPASSSRARPSWSSTRPMIRARPDAVLLGAGLAGAAGTASLIAAAGTWWWRRLTRATPTARSTR